MEKSIKSQDFGILSAALFSGDYSKLSTTQVGNIVRSVDNPISRMEQIRAAYMWGKVTRDDVLAWDDEYGLSYGIVSGHITADEDDPISAGIINNYFDAVMDMYEEVMFEDVGYAI